MARSLPALLIVIAVLALAMTVWYLVPGVWHPLVTHGDVSARHTTHAIAFFVLAVLSGIGSRFVRSGAAR